MRTAEGVDREHTRFRDRAVVAGGEERAVDHAASASACNFHELVTRRVE